MNLQLRRLLDVHDGVLTRRMALGVVSRGVLNRAVASGDLCRLHPRVYVDPARREHRLLRWRAALAYGGPDAALCSVTALAVWGLAPADGDIHLLTPGSVRLRDEGGLVTHRRDQVDRVVRSGLPVTRLEQSVVDSARVIAPEDRRAPFIEVVARRMTTPDRLRAAVEATPNLPDRQMLLRLTAQLAMGCRSELELWGHDHVFYGAGMPRLQRQTPVRVGGRMIYLDVYAERERVNFELDGAAYHSSQGDRERDLRRDAALGALGIMVVRFSHRRLTTEPEEVRRDVLAILATRRGADDPDHWAPRSLTRATRAAPWPNA